MNLLLAPPVPELMLALLRGRSVPRVCIWLEARIEAKGGEVMGDQGVQDLCAEMGNPSKGGGPELMAAAKVDCPAPSPAVSPRSMVWQLSCGSGQAVTGCTTTKAAILELVKLSPRFL